MPTSRKRASIIIRKKTGPKKKPVITDKPKPSIASRRKTTIQQRSKKHAVHQSDLHKKESTLTSKSQDQCQCQSQSQKPTKTKILITTTTKPKRTRITRIKCAPKQSSQSQSQDQSQSQSQSAGINARSHKMNAECFKIIKKLDPKGTLTREQLIYELETLRHKLQGKLEINTNDSNISMFYNNVVAILCDVKAKDIGKKVEVNESEKSQIIASFKKKFKKMEEKKFAGVVDLTAPKSERKPEVGVRIWRKSKDVTFKDNTYRKANNALTRKFRKYNVQKSMDDSLVNKLNNKLAHNLNKYNIVKNHPDKLGYKKYNPLTYTGVKWC